MREGGTCGRKLAGAVESFRSDVGCAFNAFVWRVSADGVRRLAPVSEWERSIMLRTNVLCSYRLE
jgi:hypothetical protein